MSNFTLSPNMNLPVPTVGVETGPQWATDLDNCLALVDSHNHAPGYGVQINPDGININADLSFNVNNATYLKSVRFSPLAAPLTAASPNLGCLFESIYDLYYNDGIGNQIRITQNGAIAGTPGSISGLVAPASVSYVPINTTFVFQSDINTPANIDAGSYIIRDILANSKGITLSAPNALAADYTLTLPAAAAQTRSVLSTDASGASLWQASYHAIVGSAGQVTAGSANYSTLSAAISASSANWRILVLPGAWTENITVNTTLNITGSGKSTIITGNLSVAGATYCVIQGLAFVGNVSLDSSSSGNLVTNCYIGASNTATDSGSGNFVQLFQG